MTKGTVLVIDDRLEEIKYHLLSLEREGYEVTCVASAGAALEQICSRRFDIVVLDVVMPFDMDAGVHLAIEIRKNSPHSRILVFTAYIQKEIFEWFAADSKARLLMKLETDPFRFVEEVNALMENKRRAPKVFIVCGRDKTAWLDLKNYLQNRLGFPEPVILAEQDSLGDTVIEKFERYASDIDIAFVIITPDDVGQLANAAGTSQGRARQNVLFELGYFMGKLGRKSGRLVLLHRSPLEMASDLAGIIYIDISNGIETAGEEIRRSLACWL